jgi:REP element-mobilizing transposase RayT
MLRQYEYRRKMPHFQPDFKAFFITFCTYRRWVIPETARDIVMKTCLSGNGKRFRLHGLVVMPDHVHVVLTPVADGDGPIRLAEIMQSIKGASAHRINHALGRRGPVWQQEFFDRALRHEESIEDKVDYMLGNPVAAGLVQNPLEYRWVWRETGGDARPPST